MSQDRWEISRIEALEKAAEAIQREKEGLEKQHDRLLNIASDKSSEIFKLRGEKLALEQENKRLRAALKGANEYIGELQDDKVGCRFCEKESLCFTCGLLLSASDTIHKALEGK